MKVAVHLRKGSTNKKFCKIVDDIAIALEHISSEGRIKEQLLPILRKNRKNLGAAWQDGDELHNILGRKSEHRFDIYNWENKTAVEIEESEVKYVWKDLVKLAIGARRNRVSNAILICPLSYGGKTLKKKISIYAQAIKVSNFMSDFLWMKNLAIIGYSRT